MPRRLRLKLAGVPFHIIQRGHNRAACFFAEADYARYLSLLQPGPPGCLKENWLRVLPIGLTD